MDYKSPFCGHYLKLDDDAKAAEIVSCPCGLNYRVGDLRSFAKLNEQIDSAKSKLADLVKKMAAISREGASQPTQATAAAQSTTQWVSATPSYVPAPAYTSAPGYTPAPAATGSSTMVGQPNFKTPPVAQQTAPARIKRERAAISVQQWLIIGAAFLVFVAGSIFVSANIATLSSGEFLAITTGVSIATGFAAFKGRKFSVLLSNFMAAFSSVMLMFSMLIIGDMLYPFTWDTAPQSWWAVTLFTVSVSSTVLARFSANFGWKAISPVTFTFAGFFFTYGTVGTALRNVTNGYPWQLLTLSATIIALLYLLRFLKSIGHRTGDIQANKEYEEDLQRREENALNRYAQFATAVLAIFAVALTVTQTFSLLFNPIDPIASLALGLVWIFGAQTIDHWGTPLSASGTVDTRIRRLAWVLGFVNVGLGLVSFANEIQSKLIGTIVALLVIALLLVSPALKRLDSEQVGIDFGVWSSAAAWLVWSDKGSWVLIARPNSWVGFAFFWLAFALLLSFGDLVAKKPRNQIIGVIASGLGLVSIAFGYVASVGSQSQNPTLWILALLVAAIIFRVAQVWTNGRIGRNVAPQIDVALVSIQGIAAFLILGNGGLALDANVALTLSLILLGIVLAIQFGARLLDGQLSKSLGAYLRLQSYLALALVGVELLSLQVWNGSLDSSNAFIVIAAALALVNYTIALLQKRFAHAIIGLGAVLLATSVAWIPLVRTFSPGVTFSLTVLTLAVIAAAHTWLITTRFEVSKAWVYASVIGPVFGTGSILTLLHLSGGRLSSTDNIVIQATLTVLSLVVLAASFRGMKLGSLTIKPASESLLSRILSVGFAFWALIFSNLNDVTGLVAGLILALAVLAANIAVREYVSLAGLYIALFITAVSANNLVTAWVSTNQDLSAIASYPELTSIWFALAISLGSALSGDLLRGAKKYAIWDASLAVIALGSISYAYRVADKFEENLIRALVAFLVLAALSYWRTVTLKHVVPLVGAYVFGITALLQLTRVIEHFTNTGISSAELYGLAVGLGISGASAVGGELLRGARRAMTFDVPVLMVASISLLSALFNDPTQGAQLLRVLIDSAVFAAFGIWRALSLKSIPWLVLGYVGGLSFALATGRLLELNIQVSEPTPEIYSVIIASAIFGLNLVLGRLRAISTTLVSWGVPLGALVIPSAIATSATGSATFAQLSTEQVVRTIVVLLASLALFVFGVRRGNLGQTTIGVIGLALVAWIRTETVSGTAMFELRGLILAFVLFLALAALRKYASTGGNSLLYIGLPTAVALLPALVNALAALSEPKLNPVDWWRFGLLLVASLALLVVGALREQAGMFFPGLIGVLTTALPYGFKGVSNQSWFLWVILLLVAGIMVWIAVRLEQMRKLGQSSINWIKELK